MLAQTKYDPETKRAYIELLRDQDDDGSDVAVVVIFSLQTTAGATQRTIEQEILRKALHLLTSATGTLSGGWASASAGAPLLPEH
jgi:hypothetical protein